MVSCTMIIDLLPPSDWQMGLQPFIASVQINSKQRVNKARDRVSFGSNREALWSCADRTWMASSNSRSVFYFAFPSGRSYLSPSERSVDKDMLFSEWLDIRVCEPECDIWLPQTYKFISKYNSAQVPVSSNSPIPPIHPLTPQLSTAELGCWSDYSLAHVGVIAAVSLSFGLYAKLRYRWKPT